MTFLKKVKLLPLLLAALFLAGCSSNTSNTNTSSSSSATSEATSSSSSASSAATANSPVTTTGADPGFETQDIDVPKGTVLDSAAVISNGVTSIVDSADGSYKSSMTVTGLERVNWNVPGKYQVRISASYGTDNDDSDIDIYVKEGIMNVQRHVDADDNDADDADDMDD